MSNPHPTLSLWKGEVAATCSVFRFACDVAGELREKLGDQGLSRFQGAARRIRTSTARFDADQHGRASDARRHRADYGNGGKHAAELGTATALANATGKFSRQRG